MNKFLVCFILIVLTLLVSSVLAAVPFTDVNESHWAYEYIDKMQILGVINGYPDGTFKPDDKVKTSEYMKMASMITWPKFNYQAPTDGSHWSIPYLKSLPYTTTVYGVYYDDARLEKVLTRGEAAILLSNGYQFYRIIHEKPITIDNDEAKYISKYSDIDENTDPKLRTALSICTQFELINGFEDSTFRPDESLTRAQVAKLMYGLRNK